MVQLIIGESGKGKSKVLLEKVNTEIKEALGNFVFLDTNTKHMYDLNNKIRLINVSDFELKNSDEFVGFLCGIISQDHDLQKVYVDNFAKVAHCDVSSLPDVVKRLEIYSNTYKLDFILTVSANMDDVDESIKENVLHSL